MNLEIQGQEEDQIVDLNSEVGNKSQNPKIPKGNAQLFFEMFEEIMFFYLPMVSIVLLNMINFGCYILCAFLFMFWLISVILFNILDLARSPITHSIQYLIVLILFINYLANDQSNI